MPRLGAGVLVVGEWDCTVDGYLPKRASPSIGVFILKRFELRHGATRSDKMGVL